MARIATCEQINNVILQKETLAFALEKLEGGTARPSLNLKHVYCAILYHTWIARVLET